MTSLHQSTQRRIKKIPQIPSVWEGDRRLLENIDPEMGAEIEQRGECIIWIDGSEGIVRAMDMVSSEQGPEAIVRTLLRAIENPHSPAQPARPQKIVVRDREIQFFLRGALQDLDINIDYAPKLPLIDELFKTLNNTYRKRPPQLPPGYAEKLEALALELWKEEIWDVIADYEIIAIEIGLDEPITVYVSVMGMLGQEYGVILYRSLDSLRRFRETVLAEKSMHRLESAFLSQDCWFVNFDIEDFDEDDEDDEDFDLQDVPLDEIKPLFGSLHPYEGMRPFLDEDEAIAVYLSLEALRRFFLDHFQELQDSEPEKLTNNYKIPLPKNKKKGKNIPVKVSNLPELSQQLLEMMESHEDDEDDDEGSLRRIPIEDDLIPEKSWINFRLMDWKEVEQLKNNPKVDYHRQSIAKQGKGLPIIIVQTSKSKAEYLIQEIKGKKGIKGLAFDILHNPFTDEEFDVGIIHTNDDVLHLLSEFNHEDGLREWSKLCHKCNDSMALVIAMGVTGASKANPQLKHILAVFETRLISEKELGMGIVQLD